MAIEIRLNSLPTRKPAPSASTEPATTGPASTDLDGTDPASIDLDSPEQIAEMVRSFYATVERDELLGHVFVDVAEVDWDTHLPKLTAFWNRALLGIEGYQGNPFRQHSEVNDREPFRQEHFDRWLELFRANLDGRWAGPNVDRALDLVHRVAEVHAGQLVRDDDRA